MERYLEEFKKEIKTQISSLIKLLLEIQQQTVQKIFKTSLENFEKRLDKEFDATSFKKLLEITLTPLFSDKELSLTEIEKKIGSTKKLYRLTIHINLIRTLGKYNN
jgi:hypothetical protein